MRSNDKKRRIVAAVIVLLLVVAMIVPLLTYALYGRMRRKYEKMDQ